MSNQSGALAYSKDFLSKATCNGLFYYYIILGYINLDREMNKTISIPTPFGNDKSKQFYLHLDKELNEWHFFDESSPGLKGNMFEFAALVSNNKLPRDERAVCILIHHKLGIDSPTYGVCNFTEEQIQEVVSLKIESPLHSHPILNHVRSQFGFERKNIYLSPVDAETKMLPSSFYEMPTVGQPKPIIKQKKSIRTANERLEDAKHLPEISPFMDVFIQNGELVFLFGDTGKGKSVLAVQISDAISKGQPIMGLVNKMPPTKVLFYDFELNDKQFGNRYINSDSGQKYSFSDDLCFVNIDLSKISDDKTTKFEEALIKKINKDIGETGAGVLVIDNISFLSIQDAQDGQVAQALMKHLLHLKENNGLTVLVLAHTTKRSISSITVNDMAGSKKLVNFADAIIALGQCKSDPTNRYLKQVKARSSVMKFDENNVLECTISKTEGFLKFENLGFCSERELLKGENQDEEIQEKKEEVYAMYLNGKTCRQIEEEKGIGKSTVSRWINEMKKSVPCPTVQAS